MTEEMDYAAIYWRGETVNVTIGSLVTEGGVAGAAWRLEQRQEWIMSLRKNVASFGGNPYPCVELSQHRCLPSRG